MDEPNVLPSTLEPLRLPAFRRIWIASLFCNAGQHLLGATAAWVMLRLTNAPKQVALVQTALMLPLMLLALPAGALADIYDRRKVAIVALLIASAGAAALLVLSIAGMINPDLILVCCFIVGTGVAFLTPAWAASVMELVGPRSLPAGVALNSMSNNLARSVGPILGGFAVMRFGASTAFGAGALLWLPMLAALYGWRRPYKTETDWLTPESLARATFAGLRYAAFSSPVRRVLIRATVLSVGTSAVYALLPLVARSTLQGDAGTYGLLLGAFGLGAVAVTVFGGAYRHRLASERSVRLHSALQGAAIVVLAVSPFTWLSCAALFTVGACWITNNATLNVSIQMTTPRWIAGRLLALFYAPVAGGLGVGSWLWGQCAVGIGIAGTLEVAGILLLLSPLLGLKLRLPLSSQIETLSVPATTSPEIGIDIHGHSGPVVLEITYRIREDRIPLFNELSQRIRRSRARNGAYGVTLARDIADPWSWTERCHYPTWHDYVRSRERPTQPERELQIRINELHEGPGPVSVRRQLERPYGSLSRTSELPESSGNLL